MSGFVVVNRACATWMMMRDPSISIEREIGEPPRDLKTNFNDASEASHLHRRRRSISASDDPKFLMRVC